MYSCYDKGQREDGTHWEQRLAVDGIYLVEISSLRYFSYELKQITRTDIQCEVEDACRKCSRFSK